MHFDWSALATAAGASVTIVALIGKLALGPIRKALDARLENCDELYRKVGNMAIRTAVLEARYEGMDKKLDELKTLIKEVSEDVKELGRK